MFWLRGWVSIHMTSCENYTDSCGESNWNEVQGVELTSEEQENDWTVPLSSPCLCLSVHVVFLRALHMSPLLSSEGNYTFSSFITSVCMWF